jgi:hypothetical protein
VESFRVALPHEVAPHAFQQRPGVEHVATDYARGYEAGYALGVAQPTLHFDPPTAHVSAQYLAGWAQGLADGQAGRPATP